MVQRYKKHIQNIFYLQWLTVLKLREPCSNASRQGRKSKRESIFLLLRNVYSFLSIFK